MVRNPWERFPQPHATKRKRNGSLSCSHADSILFSISDTTYGKGEKVTSIGKRNKTYTYVFSCNRTLSSFVFFLYDTDSDFPRDRSVTMTTQTVMKRERFKAAVAVHVFLLRGREVLLLRRYNTGYEDGNYSVVAGHLDGGEDVIAAAIREAKEEAGIELARSDVRVVGVMHRLESDERIDFFVAAERWAGEIVNCEPDKCDELRWCDLEQLPGNTIPYVQQALDNFRAGIWFDSVGFQERPKGGEN
jgi:8-oxo-dGTP diphosphatase